MHRERPPGWGLRYRRCLVVSRSRRLPRRCRRVGPVLPCIAGMTNQFDLFAAEGAREPARALPEGFRYQPNLIGAEEEAELIDRIRELPFKEFEFHGYTGKRRVVSFGWK